VHELVHVERGLLGPGSFHKTTRLQTNGLGTKLRLRCRAQYCWAQARQLQTVYSILRPRGLRNEIPFFDCDNTASATS
jgi:hypothetical protein